MRNFVAAAAALALTLLSQPTHAFTFPAPEHAVIVDVPADYVGEVWANARTDSGDTVWNHCSSVVRSYGGIATPANVRNCVANAADANRTTTGAFARLRIGESLVLPLTAAAAEQYRLTTATAATEPGLSALVPLFQVLTDQIAALGKKFDASLTNRDGGGTSSAVLDRVDQSTASLADEIRGIAPQIESALAGDHRADEGLVVALVLSITIIAALCAGMLLIAFHRRHDNRGVGITSDELRAALTDNNNEILNRFGGRRDELVKLANGINDMEVRLNAERDRTNRLTAELAELTDYETERTYMLDGVAVGTYRLHGVIEGIKWYNTGETDPVREDNLKSHFAKRKRNGRAPLRAAAE